MEMLTNVKSYSRTRGITLTALFAVLLAFFSILSIPLPFSVVPITLQVFVVFLIVNLLGSYYGTLACLIYLLMGVSGLPVFAGGSAGPGVLFGPLGGYLMAFPIASLLGGQISGKVSKSKTIDLIRVSLASTISLVMIYAIGVLWLAESTRFSIAHAIIVGALPFVPVDAIKAIIAIPLALFLRRSRHDLPVHKN
jgi:biotin transport system substrate-specific component